MDAFDHGQNRLNGPWISDDKIHVIIGHDIGSPKDLNVPQDVTIWERQELELFVEMIDGEKWFCGTCDLILDRYKKDENGTIIENGYIDTINKAKMKIQIQLEHVSDEPSPFWASSIPYPLM